MKANALLKLHQRQVDLLDMIVRCNNNINAYESDIRLYESWKNLWVYQKTINHHKGKVQKYTAIKQRLVSYYKDIQVRIMSLQPELELTESEAQLIINDKLS